MGSHQTFGPGEHAAMWGNVGLTQHVNDSFASHFAGQQLSYKLTRALNLFGRLRGNPDLHAHRRTGRLSVPTEHGNDILIHVVQEGLCILGFLAILLFEVLITFWSIFLGILQCSSSWAVSWSVKYQGKREGHAPMKYQTNYLTNPRPWVF